MTTTNPATPDIDASAEEVARSSFDIVARIKPMLAGHGTEVQGAVLADLVSLWLAGHEPAGRQGIFALWIKHTLRLVDLSEAEIFGPAGHPARREDAAE